MAQSAPGSGGPSPERSPHVRAPRAARRGARGALGSRPREASSCPTIPQSPVTPRLPPGASHPLARSPLAGARRASLRELAARPGRFEHHLVVVARAGGAQLEIATASASPSTSPTSTCPDEYAIALPTGDDTTDRFPLRTFLTDARTLAGRRPATTTASATSCSTRSGRCTGPGACGPRSSPSRSRAACGGAASASSSALLADPGGRAPAGATAGREPDAKSYAAQPPPLMLRETDREAPSVVARVGEASLTLVVRPRAARDPRGAYVLVLDADAGVAHHSCDPDPRSPRRTLDATGIARALVFASHAGDAGAPPPFVGRVPTAPMAPFEDGPRAALPAVLRRNRRGRGGRASRGSVTLGAASAVVPRHWLARMLFRVALHPPALGYVETYGGFFYDDRAGTVFAWDSARAGRSLVSSDEARAAGGDVPRGGTTGVHGEAPGLKNARRPREAVVVNSRGNLGAAFFV